MWQHFCTIKKKKIIKQKKKAKTKLKSNQLFSWEYIQNGVDQILKGDLKDGMDGKLVC